MVSVLGGRGGFEPTVQLMRKEMKNVCKPSACGALPFIVSLSA